MATSHLYLDTRRIKNNQTYSLKISIRHKGKFLISTPFSSSIECFNGAEFTSKDKNYKTKNVSLRNLINKVENTLLKLGDENKLSSMSDKALKSYIENIIDSKGVIDTKVFIDYLEEYISSKTKQGTVKTYITTRNKILSFDPLCTFETMDRKWLISFENYMISEGLKINAYAIHLRNIRAIFNYAIDEEITTLYPFRKFKIKKENTRKRCLTIEQLITLKNYPCEIHQERPRDMFMLMFYLIGINASDLFNLKDISGNRIEYNRAKTGRLYSIKIEPEAYEIIKKYSGKNQLLNILDTYSNYQDFLHRMNINLKEIGLTERKGLGGKKERSPLFPDLSSYWARHTWATIAAELDIPKETISEALGHEMGSSVTSIYIKFDRKKIDEANRKVIDYVNDPVGYMKKIKE